MAVDIIGINAPKDAQYLVAAASATLTNETVIATSANLASIISDETGSGSLVFATSPSLVTPDIGTPSAGTLTNCTGLPITGLASGTSANLASVISDETGSGALVFATSPTLVTPALGTPSSGTLTNCTGLPITGLASGTSANLAGVISDETGSGSLVFATSPTLVTPDLGTPSAATLTNATGLPVSTGISGLGTGVATFLATPSSANLASAVTDETGTGALVFADAPQMGSIELGNASDTTLSRSAAGVLAVEGVVVPTVSSTSTLTNKAITPRVVTTADDATAVIDVDVTDVYELTAMANNTVFTTTGTPVDGQKIIVRVKDDGISRTLTWTAFTQVGVTLPAATTASKWLYVGATYNSGDAAWHAIALSQEA